jgi:hypothetical protein
MARKRKVNQWLELEGEIFEPAMEEKVKDAIAEGIEHLGDEGAGIMMSAISAAGFVRTGATVRSVESVYKRSGSLVAGYATVAPRNMWPAPNRPTKMWMEEGRRGRGDARMKLRRGTGAFRKTKTALNRFKLEFIAERIAKALN